MMQQIAYGIGVGTSILCAVLLIRSYVAQRTPLLLWSSLCFGGLALNNVLLFADLFLIPDMSLELLRSATALASLTLMLIGLIGEEA